MLDECSLSKCDCTFQLDFVMLMMCLCNRLTKNKGPNILIYKYKYILIYIYIYIYIEIESERVWISHDIYLFFQIFAYFYKYTVSVVQCNNICVLIKKIDFDTVAKLTVLSESNTNWMIKIRC